MADTRLEYRVKRITRYVITRHEEDLSGRCGSTVEKGTYDNADVAHEVAYALCKQDHERLGYPPGDDRIKYPDRDGVSVAAALGLIGQPKADYSTQSLGSS